VSLTNSHILGTHGIVGWYSWCPWFLYFFIQVFNIINILFNCCFFYET